MPDRRRSRTLATPARARQRRARPRRLSPDARCQRDKGRQRDQDGEPAQRARPPQRPRMAPVRRVTGAEAIAALLTSHASHRTEPPCAPAIRVLPSSEAEMNRSGLGGARLSCCRIAQLDWRVGRLVLPAPVVPEVLLGRLSHEPLQNARVRRDDPIDVALAVPTPRMGQPRTTRGSVRRAPARRRRTTSGHDSAA